MELYSINFEPGGEIQNATKSIELKCYTSMRSSSPSSIFSSVVKNWVACSALTGSSIICCWCYLRPPSIRYHFFFYVSNFQNEICYCRSSFLWIEKIQITQNSYLLISIGIPVLKLMHVWYCCVTERTLYTWRETDKSCIWSKVFFVPSGKTYNLSFFWRTDATYSMNGIEHYRSGLSISQFKKGFRRLLNLEKKTTINWRRCIFKKICVHIFAAWILREIFEKIIER